jgi:hypothetical protein
MRLLNWLRIELAILKVVNEKPQNREELPHSLGVGVFDQALESVVNRLIAKEWLVEQNGRFHLGSKANMTSIQTEIDKIGPFGMELVNKLQSEIKKHNIALGNGIIFQDVSPNPTGTFLRYYYVEEWRLVQFLLLKRAFDCAETVFDPLLSDPAITSTLYMWQSLYGDSSHYLYSTVKRGLLNEMRNMVFFYTEDLAALLISTRSVANGNADKFLKRFLDYPSSKVDDFYRKKVPTFKSGKGDSEIRDLLCYPKPHEECLQHLVGQRERFLALIKESVKRFEETISEIASFYLKHKDAFLQYKHGQKNFFKPSVSVDDESFERLRKEEGVGIIAYPKKRSKTVLKGLDIPDDRVILELQTIDVEKLEETARKIHWLMVLIISNLVGAYYPNELNEPMYFLAQAGWKGDPDERYIRVEFGQSATSL